MQPRPVRFPAVDGGDLAGDVAEAASPWAGAVVCHPHPAYGGDRHNAVVDRVFRSLAAAGVTAVRFDFRASASASASGGPGAGDDPAAGSERSEHDDVVAALDLVTASVGPDRPVWLVGYSFGADIVLAVGDPRAAGWVAVAPPLRFGDRPCPAAGDPRPVLVLAAEHDQFNPPDRLRSATGAWPDATVEVVPMADHFLAGAADRVAGAIVGWLRSRSGPEG